MRVALSLLFAVVFLCPIGFWVVLNLYFGQIPNEATLFGLNLRVVLASVSGLGLLMLLVTNLALSLRKRQH